MTQKQLSTPELLAQPPTMNLRTLGHALGISEPVVRELHRRGELEALGIRIHRLGAQWRVVTADVLRFLGIGPSHAAEPGSVHVAFRGQPPLIHRDGGTHAQKADQRQG